MTPQRQRAATAQMALDALPAWRTRDGIWPTEAHQRGQVRLPYQCVGGDEGDLLPAWVCCRCGGVALSAHLLGNSHACCRGLVDTCVRRRAIEHERQHRPAHERILPQYGPLDLCWLPP